MTDVDFEQVDWDLILQRIRAMTYKGKPQERWSFEDYWSYIYDTFRPGVVLTPEMVVLLGAWQTMAYNRLRLTTPGGPHE